jgi:hypothetical protein
MTTTTTSTLTDRYVDAILRRVPERQRPDIERELRASIADAVDDRLETGADPAEAEVAVLTELGDPARLAAGYTDRPLHLIGPALYLDYIRLLRAMLATIVPTVAAAFALVETVQGQTLGRIIGASISGALTTAVHIVAWTTLAFAVIERTPGIRMPLTGPWTPAHLPAPPSRRARYGELITLTVVTVLACTLVLLSPVVSPKTDANGDPIGILSPWLWDTGVVYVLIALVIASLGVAYAKHYLRWSVPHAIAGSLIDIASPLLMVWLATTDRVLNPAFVEAVGWSPGVVRWINAGLVVTAVGTIIQTLVEGVRRARRG